MLSQNLRDIITRKLIEKLINDENNLEKEIKYLYSFLPDDEISKQYKRKCVESKARIIKLNLTEEEKKELIKNAMENMPVWQGRCW